jgi:hypothetical protein
MAKLTKRFGPKRSKAERDQAAVWLKTVLTDERRLEAVLGEAVRLTLLDHKRAGNPIVVYQDGKIVILPASDIKVS